jgi:hypothetical protein
VLGILVQEIANTQQTRASHRRLSAGLSQVCACFRRFGVQLVATLLVGNLLSPLAKYNPFERLRIILDLQV